MTSTAPRDEFRPPGTPTALEESRPDQRPPGGGSLLKVCEAWLAIELAPVNHRLHLIMPRAVHWQSSSATQWAPMGHDRDRSAHRWPHRQASGSSPWRRRRRAQARSPRPAERRPCEWHQSRGGDKAVERAQTAQSGGGALRSDKRTKLVSGMSLMSANTATSGSSWAAGTSWQWALAGQEGASSCPTRVSDSR
jgi:hypothetical protein